MLEVKNICKKFAEHTILDNFSFSVENGKILALVGESGGGKTTLLRCISGLETIDSGEILIDGVPIKPLQIKGHESPVGVVFQDFNLYPHLSVLENITLAPRLVLKQKTATANQQAKDLLHLLKLEQHINKMPFELSGGQKQRVAIARALAMQPKVLCYDEPTSALDPDLVNNVADIILQLKNKQIIQLIVTHDHLFAGKIADQIIEVTPLKLENN